MATVLLGAAVGILLGSALGVFGGGGGILAIPMLVGLLGMDIDEAAAASLVIVLFGALGGLVSHHRGGRVLWVDGLLFGTASIIGAAGGALLAAQVADWVKLGAFTAVMVVAGIAMLRNARRQPASRVVGQPVPHGPRAEQGRGSIALILLLATGTGLVTGFLGVGGGFLVVPALVLSLRMAVANATATGLVVVAMASTTALGVRLTHSGSVGDPALMAVIVTATVAASLAAARLSARLSPRALGTGFAGLVLAMSTVVGLQAIAAAP